MFIIRLFIKDYKDIDNPKVREKYGTVCSIYSIFCNILMVIFKLLISFLTNSVSIRADAFNNLSDAGSNIATLFAILSFFTFHHPGQNWQEPSQDDDANCLITDRLWDYRGRSTCQ